MVKQRPEQISVCLDAELRKFVVQKAKQQGDRSVSSLVRELVAEDKRRDAQQQQKTAA